MANTPFYRLPESGQQGLTSQLVAAHRAGRRHRAGAVRDRLLPALVPAGALRRRVPGRGQQQPRARRPRRGAARRDPRPQRQARWSPTAARGRCRSTAGATASTSARSRTLVVTSDDFSPVLTRLSRVLGEPRTRIKARMLDSLQELPFANATAAVDVTFDDVVAIRETQEDFPGIDVSQTFERSYPHGTARRAPLRLRRARSATSSSRAATTRTPSRATASARTASSRPTTATCAAAAGTQRIQVDVAGRQRGELPGAEPEPGDDLRLSIDLGVQQAGEEALRWPSGGSTGTGGAFVAMDITRRRDPRPRQLPDLRPRRLHRRSAPEHLQAADQRAERRAAVQPRDRRRSIRRARPSSRSPRSRRSRAASRPGTVINDGGSMKVGDQTFQNAGKAVYGPVNLRRRAAGLVRRLLLHARATRPASRAARSSRTGRARSGSAATPASTCPARSKGLVPTARWRNDLREQS